MTRLERMYRHVLESEMARGRSYKVARRIAAATVNRHRAARARGRTVCRSVYCRYDQGPALIGEGGSRRQWYPGKKTGKREVFACLGHGRRFRSKAGYLAHLRSH